MKSVVLLYNTSCIFEIVTLNYFLKYANKDVLFVSVDGKAITSTEGYSINVDMALDDVDPLEIGLFIIAGGDVGEIDRAEVHKLIKELADRGALVAGICAGVDVLENSGILAEAKSTKNTDLDCVVDNNIITARANAHVDFAIEVSKKLDIFEGEDDIKETIAFWKEHKRAE